MGVEDTYNQVAGHYRRMIEVQFGLKSGSRTSNVDFAGLHVQIDPPTFFVPVDGIIGQGIVPCLFQCSVDHWMIPQFLRCWCATRVPHWHIVTKIPLAQLYTLLQAYGQLTPGEEAAISR